jgi:hypothetical protein
MVPEKEYFNQRTFNINDILGDFSDDVLQDEAIRQEDSRGRPVTPLGYLLSN